MPAAQVPLPQPEEINRLLVTLSDYGVPEGLTSSAVIGMMSSNSFGARIANHEQTLAFAKLVGLLEEEGGRFRLTQRARRLLALNVDHSYELASGQAAQIAAICVFEGPYREIAASLFGRFSMDSATGVLAAKVPFVVACSPIEQNLFAFLRALGIVRVNGSQAEVDGLFTVRGMQLRQKRPITPEELDLILAERAQRGFAAELKAIEFERSRLRSARCEVESEQVSLVSRYDVTAGYDIASYDGPSASLSFDRFIEVKSTVRDEAVFIWTANERQRAAELGASYWIYLATSFQPDVQQPAWILIRDPESERRSGRLQLDPLSFRVVVQQ